MGQSWRQSLDSASANAIESVAGWANWHVVRDAPRCSPANADGDSVSNPPTSDDDDSASLNCSPMAVVDSVHHPVVGDDSVDNC